MLHTEWIPSASLLTGHDRPTGSQCFSTAPRGPVSGGFYNRNLTVNHMVVCQLCALERRAVAFHCPRLGRFDAYKHNALTNPCTVKLLALTPGFTPVKRPLMTLC